MRREIRAVAFDLDGTLYPNYSLNIKLIPLILKELPLIIAFGKARGIIRKEQETSPVFPVEDFYQYQASITAKILRLSEKTVREKIERLIYRSWEPLFKKISLFPHTAQCLTALKNEGYKMGLLSDFPPEAKLEHLSLAGYWDAVICSECTGALKPHERPFMELASALDLPLEEILYVGNSLRYDVAGASRVGMKTAWIRSPIALPVGNKYPSPDFIFNDYRQLHDYMLN